MEDNSSGTYYQDGLFYHDKRLLPFTDSGTTFYEVLRVMKGVPLFLDDHLLRLISSVEKEMAVTLDAGVLQQHLRQFMQQKPLNEGNIKLMILFSAGVRTYSVLIYQVKHHYPTAQAYREGVTVLFSGMQRSNPTVKKWNASLRKQAEALKSKHQVYEVLLTDEQGHITEGSRSNIFFVQSGELITAPEEAVLPGITRNKIIAICHEKGIRIRYQTMPYEELDTLSEAFLTGTSPKVLPVKKIDTIRFTTPSSFVKSIMKAYDKMIDHAIATSGA